MSYPASLAGTRVLVLGEEGYISARLVERLLLEWNANVRVMVPSFNRAFHLARFPIEIVRGDASIAADVEQAVEAHDVVFHFGDGYSPAEQQNPRNFVERDKAVLDAAAHARVKRWVRINAGTLHAAGPDGVVSEDTKSHEFRTVCPAGKLKPDQTLAYAARAGLPMVVLQPAVVYGPYARLWTVDVLEKLRTGRVILVNGGNGICNAVYVDDLVSMALLAATKDKAIGETFFVVGENPVTWRDFYAAYEQMSGVSATVQMTAAEAETYSRKQNRKTPLLKELLNILQQNPQIRYRIAATRELAPLVRAAKSLLPNGLETVKKGIRNNENNNKQPAVSTVNRAVHPLDPPLLSFYAAKTRVSTDKAKRLLGYRPGIDFSTGMRITQQWAIWANLVEPAG